ncbi:MAG: LLM class flavin-dependent oxidoreductase, partial [Armatimonadetes bacterium]|nr:LLM class flavin-dependent oxidoreductase [Armatimonadota bacterium]
RMHPAVFAQRLATLDQVSGGRIVLGLGSGEAMNVEAYGIPWDKPVSRMLESLRVIRGLLSGGEPFTFEGQYFTLRNARLSVRPYKGRRLPIYLAALGTRTQAITGHEADGWLPVVIPAQHYAHYLAPVLAGAREAGRDPDEIERVAMVPVALGDNISFEDVKRLAKPHALSLIWKPVVERMGIPFDPPAHLRDTHYITVDPMDPESVRRYHEFQEWIPADMLPPFVVYGDMAAVKRGLGAYVEAGATHLYLMNVSPDPIGALVRIASEIIPYFARRRPPLLAQMARTALPLMEKSGMMGRLLGPMHVRRATQTPVRDSEQVLDI